LTRMCNAGRAGAHLPSEALHPTRSSDVLPPDRAGARLYRATRCENASKYATPDRAGARPYRQKWWITSLFAGHPGSSRRQK
jgi:hypothetical protein